MNNLPDRSSGHLLLFFSWSISLERWEKIGILDREVRLYEALNREGFQISFATYGGNRDQKIATRYPFLNVIPLYDTNPSSLLFFFKSVKSFFPGWIHRQVKSNTIFKTNQMRGAWVGVLAKWMTGKPLVVRCGFEQYQLLQFQNAPLWKQIFYYWISKVAYGTAERIILTTEDIKNYVIRTFRIPGEKINVIPNSVDTNQFSIRSFDPEEKTTILFVGRLNMEKNLFSLLKAGEKTGVSLTLTGSGSLRNNLETWASTREINVVFTGQVPNDRLPELYHQHPIFILPSHHEGHPKALLEAMSCGCAVIGTNVPGIRNIIQHEKNGLLCEPDVDSIAEAITRLKNDIPLRKQLGDSARKYVLQTCSLSTVVKQEADLYRYLMKEYLHRV